MLTVGSIALVRASFRLELRSFRCFTCIEDEEVDRAAGTFKCSSSFGSLSKEMFVSFVENCVVLGCLGVVVCLCFLWHRRPTRQPAD